MSSDRLTQKLPTPAISAICVRITVNKAPQRAEATFKLKRAFSQLDDLDTGNMN
jgi:hypothetical protein